MLVLALVIHRLTSGLRRETEIAHLNEQRARQLQHLAVRLAACNTADDISALGQQAFDDSFSGVCCGLNDASGNYIAAMSCPRPSAMAWHAA
jgi:two-component system sensor histidine kinase KdpD